MHAACSKHWINVLSNTTRLYFWIKLKADLNCWKFNFPDWQQFNFRFGRNTVMRQKFYLTLATGRVWLISYQLRLSHMDSDVGQIFPTARWQRDHLILYALVCEKENPSLGITICHHDPRDGFFYPTLTLMMDSYRVKPGNFGQQVNSDIHLQTVTIQMRRLLMSRLIRIFTVCLFNLIFIPKIQKWKK